MNAKIFWALWWVMFAVSMFVTAGIILAACHFVTKFW